MDSGAGGQRPNVSESGVLSIRLSVNDTESMTVDNRGYRAWRVTRSLYVKHLFSRFRKSKHMVAALIQKANIVVVVQISIFFQWQSKVVTSVDPSLPLFYLNVYNVELVLVLNITDLLLARC
jgi:hypothetical protein